MSEVKGLQELESNLINKKKSLQADIHSAEFNELRQRDLLQKMKDKFSVLQSDVEVKNQKI